MERERIAAAVQGFITVHGTDRLSRDRLVWDVVKFIHPLPSSDQQDVREYLLEQVAAEQSEWKLAIEILAQEAAPGIPLRLKRILESHEGSPQWRHLMILGLLQLGEETGKDLYIAYVRAGLAQNREGIRVLLAALCRVDPQAAVSLASGYFARALALDKGMSEMRGSIPAFVKTYLRKDEDLLPELVRQTCLINLRAGKRLRQAIVDDLSNPAIVGEFEQARVERILIELSA